MSVVDDATLLKMAEAEILREAKRAAIRHSTVGVSGWQPGPKPNKMFLTNTLLQTMASNRILDIKTKGKKNPKCKRIERKLLQKTSKTDLSTNFIYQKPKKSKKPEVNLKSDNYNCSTQSENKNFKRKKEFEENFNKKRFKLKKRLKF